LRKGVFATTGKIVLEWIVTEDAIARGATVFHFNPVPSFQYP
jgi:hypothetical protein